MTLREAIEVFREHQKNSMKDKTRESYGHLFRNLEALLGDAAVENISSQTSTSSCSFSPKAEPDRLPVSATHRSKAFFNFIIEGAHLPITNPCTDPLLSKTFRAPRMRQREIISREVIDEIIYRCQKPRDRLSLSSRHVAA